MRLVETAKMFLSAARILGRVSTLVIVAALLASYSALMLYGDSVYTVYSHNNCSSHIYLDVGKARDASIGIWVVSIFLLVAAAAGRAHPEAKNAKMVLDVMIDIGVLGIILAGLLTMLMVFTGSCKFTVGDERNGEIEESKVVAAFLIVIGAINAVMQGLKVDEKREYGIATATNMTPVLHLAQVAVTVVIVLIMTATEKTVANDFINMSRLREAECSYAAAPLPDNKFYDAIELFRIDAAGLKAVHNPYMYNLAYVITTCTCLQFILYFWQMCGQLHGKAASSDMVVTAVMIVGHWAHIVAGVSIALFAASAALANEVAACSPLNSSNPYIMALFVSLVTFYGIGSINVLTNMSNTRFSNFLHSALGTLGLTLKSFPGGRKSSPL
jgi:hypothetical protein